MVDQEELKKRVAQAALDYVQPGEILGVGSGSTVDHFVDALGSQRARDVRAAVSSSAATTARLQSFGIEVLDLNDVEGYSIYVDGADEFDPALCMIKGGGAALTSEKIVSSLARTFVCIVDSSKRVDVLGTFPLPVEVIGMARESVCRRMRELGGDPRVRDGVTTDHGNPIIDVHGLRIVDPPALETEIETIPGVVTCGIFAHRPADVVLMSTEHSVQRFGDS